MLGSSGPPYSETDGWDDDDQLEHHPTARLDIARGFGLVDRWQRHHAPEADVRLDVERMRWIHRTIFGNVFPYYAGRFRGVGDEDDNVLISFGGNSGTHPEEVADQLREWEQFVEINMNTVDAMRQNGDPAFLQTFAELTAFAHCHLVKIHPFRNGNGRTGRAVASHVLRRYGFGPFPLTRGGDDAYIECTGRYLDSGNTLSFASLVKLRLFDSDY